MPWPSQTRGTFVPNPPCDRPSAWSCGSCACIDSGPPRRGGAADFFSRPGGRPRGADDGRIDEPQVAVDPAGAVQAQEQSVEDGGPRAVLAPAVEPVVGGLPRAVPVGQVGPRRAGVEVPQDAVDDPPVA